MNPSESEDVTLTVSSRPRFTSNTLSTGAPSDISGDDNEDSVNVVVRVRPFNSQEISRKDKQIVNFPGDGAIHVDTAVQSKSFTFNVAFEPEATQEDVFDHSGIAKLIDMAVNGYACTAFAYGQTGSGKTHTITGPPQQFDQDASPDPKDFGLIPRSFHYLLQLMNAQHGSAYRLTASYLEIYNEQVIDLLNPNQRKYLAVRWSKNKGFYVENLFTIECETLDDLMAVLEEGLRNRQTGAHSMNEFSSRSHSMLTVNIDSEMQDPDDENLYITKHGKLTFVDLAGSEKLRDSQNTEHQVESNNINKSLLVLGNCIAALGDSKRRQGHIPYRDSKLTKLLAESIGGSGVTLMIACISPSNYNGTESMNTLRYANRAKKIKNKPIVKMDPREKLILSLKREVKLLRQENQYLRQQVNLPPNSSELEFPPKPKGKLQRENDEQFLKMLKEKGPDRKPSTTDNGLYDMLQEYMIENETLRNENTDLHQLRDQSRREQQLMARENERLTRKLEDVERERSIVHTPLSIHSIGSTLSRHSTGVYYPPDGIPIATPPQIWQYPDPRGSWSREMGRHPLPNDLLPPPDGYISSSRNSVPNGYLPAAPSPRKTPPAHLQYPSKPPHRLQEPVQSQGYNGSPRHHEPSYVNRYHQQQQYYQSHPSPHGHPPPPMDKQGYYYNPNYYQPPPDPPYQMPEESQPPPRPDPPVVKKKGQPKGPPKGKPSSQSAQQPDSVSQGAESVHEMNERLQQELVDLEKQIKQTHTSQGSTNIPKQQGQTPRQNGKVGKTGPPAQGARPNVNNAQQSSQNGVPAIQPYNGDNRSAAAQPANQNQNKGQSKPAPATRTSIVKGKAAPGKR